MAQGQSLATGLEMQLAPGQEVTTRLWCLLCYPAPLSLARLAILSRRKRKQQPTSYCYTITSTGMSKGTEKTVLTDSGRFTVAAVIPNPAALNFAGYGMFIDQNTLCDGSTLVPGTITGPVFTNGSWNFGTGNYTFTDSVGQAGATVGTSTACPSGAKTIPGNVTAQQGFNVKQPAVTLPKNSFNQEQAVIDGRGVNPDGTSVPPPTQSSLSSALRNINNVPLPQRLEPFRQASIYPTKLMPTARTPRSKVEESWCREMLRLS